MCWDCGPESKGYSGNCSDFWLSEWGEEEKPNDSLRKFLREKYGIEIMKTDDFENTFFKMLDEAHKKGIIRPVMVESK